MCAVMGVSDYEAALACYGKWLGEPDETPAEGIVEWQICGGAWLQLDAARHPCSDAVVINVGDIAAAREALIAADIAVAEIEDWEVVLSCGFNDPDGNRITLVQVLG